MGSGKGPQESTSGTEDFICLRSEQEPVIHLVCILFLLVSNFLSVAVQAKEPERVSEDLIFSVLKKTQYQGSVLIAEERNIILNKGLGLANREWDISNTPGTKFKIGSITKPFTAMLVLQLVQDGKLQLDDKISEHLTDYPSENANKITIHHLLSHTSGIPDFLRMPEFEGERLRLSASPLVLTGYFKDRELDFEPGTEFRYSNSGYVLIGRIIEKVTGKSYEEVLREKILFPLKMNNTGCYRSERVVGKMATGYDHSEDGVFQAARYVDSSLAFGGGDIYSTVDDLFRFDQALYSEILLSRELIESMQQPKVTTPSGNGYGYGWDVVHTPIQFIGHLGDASGFISVIIRVPEKGRTIILLSNQSDTNLRKIGTEIYRILDQQLLDKVLE